MTRKAGRLTFKVLGSQNNGTQMVILDEALDLGGYFGAIPSHNQGLSNGPA